MHRVHFSLQTEKKVFVLTQKKKKSQVEKKKKSQRLVYNFIVTTWRGGPFTLYPS